MRKQPQAVYKRTTLQKVIRGGMAAGLGLVIGLGGAAIKNPSLVGIEQEPEYNSYREIREKYDIHSLVVNLDDYGAGQGVAVANLERLQMDMQQRITSLAPEAVPQRELERISKSVVQSYADALGDGNEAHALGYVYPPNADRARGQVICSVSGAAEHYTRTELLNMLTHLNMDMEVAEIDLDQFREMVVNHELAHCQNKPHQYPSLINETLADSYAALMAIQEHGNTELAEKFMHIRTVGLLNSTDSYVTSPALAKVIEQGRIALENGELEGLTPAQIFDRAMEMAMGPEHQRAQAIADYTEQAQRLYSGRDGVLERFAVDYRTGGLVEKGGKRVLFEYQSPALELYTLYTGAVAGLRGENTPARTAEERFADDMQEMLGNLTPQEQLEALNFQKYHIRHTAREQEAEAVKAGKEPTPYTDVYGFSIEERLAKIESYVERVRESEPVLVAERQTDSREL